MKWAAIETDDGESQVIDAETNRAIARIVSRGFEGNQIATLIAAILNRLDILSQKTEER